MASRECEEKLLKLFRKSIREFRQNAHWDHYHFLYSLENFKLSVRKHEGETNPVIVNKFVSDNTEVINKVYATHHYAAYRYDYKGEEYMDNLEQHRKFIGLEEHTNKVLFETGRVVPKPPMAKFYRRNHFRYSNKLGYIK